MNPKISIIIPVYNVEQYIQKCIDSILNQTFTDIELILVDDGSADSSDSICDEYASRDNRIKVIHKKNGGVSSARNMGIRAARGDYIGFVDSDDYIDRRMYEVLYKQAIQYNADIVVSAIKTVNEKKNYKKVSTVWKQVNKPINKEQIEKMIIPSFLKGNFYSLLSCCNKIYRLNVLKENNVFFDENRFHGEDVRFNLTLLQKINTLIFVDQPLYIYVQNDNSATQKFRSDLYNYIQDNRNYGLYLCDKYKVPHAKKRIIEEYNRNSLNFMQSLVKRNLSIEKKYTLLNEIMTDPDFKHSIHSYSCPSIYYWLLKWLSIKENERNFLRVVMMKEFVKKRGYQKKK